MIWKIRTYDKRIIELGKFFVWDVEKIEVSPIIEDFGEKINIVRFSDITELTTEFSLN